LEAVLKRGGAQLTGASEMLRIDRDAIYSKADLQRLLKAEGLDVDFVLARIRPKKLFRGHWLGRHLLDAWEDGPALNDPERGSLASTTMKHRKPHAVRRGRLGKRTKESGDSPLIGGRYRPEEIGLHED